MPQTTEETTRKLRLEDFNQRKHFDPLSVSYVPLYGWEYIAVQPMSDEVELLGRLGMKPEQCIVVDCYWLIKSDVVFLQVYSQSLLNNREPGFYAQWWDKNVPRLNLSAYLMEPMISRKKIEEVMRKFYELNLEGERFSPPQLGRQLTLVSR
jgi:hypothetical protein